MCFEPQSRDIHMNLGIITVPAAATEHDEVMGEVFFQVLTQVSM